MMAVELSGACMVVISRWLLLEIATLVHFTLGQGTTFSLDLGRSLFVVVCSLPDRCGHSSSCRPFQAGVPIFVFGGAKIFDPGQKMQKCNFFATSKNLTIDTVAAPGTAALT
ncbi:hypothetical protein [Duganella sp. HH105]|uniref:hypothetical protein n=1 Tax=Duganella sp. HH105 TaxID=1781067 RepID=UPI00114CDA02|nr:hypothetical protein [Duganella sp. HH105]